MAGKEWVLLNRCEWLNITQKAQTANKRLAKKRVNWLNEALCFLSSSVLADSLVLQNPLLRQAPNRWWQVVTNQRQDKQQTKN